jgi:streptogramin lyase
MLGLSQTVTFGQIFSGISGSIAMPATTSGEGPASITLQSTLPAGVPLPQSVGRRSASRAERSPADIGAFVTPLAYIVLDTSSALTFRATPGITLTFPAGVLRGYAYLAFFDPNNPGLGWNAIAGPVLTGATSVALPSALDASPALALSPGTPYIFALVENGSVLPTPTPAPFTIIEYYVPGAFSSITTITAGPDGNVWFFQQDGAAGESVDKITPTGVITKYQLKAPPYRDPQGITTGPDGNIWFTETANSSIGKITPAGVVTEYQLPVLESAPWCITAGPDGNVWFTQPDLTVDGGFPNGGFGGIGKITPSGVTTNYSPVLPPGTPPGTFDPVPLGIATGADGNIWFGDNGSNIIVKSTPSGVQTTYPIPSANASVVALTAGSDGNIWFVEQGVGQVAKITPSGAITEYPVPGSGGLTDIATGPDGNLWVTDGAYDQIFRITPTGAITGTYPTPTQPSGPDGITAGPDGNMWFAESGVSQIGKILLH